MPENSHLKKILCQRCVNFLFSCILISSTDRQTHPYIHSSSAPQTETPTHPPTHSVIKHLNTMKICKSFKSMELPTSFLSYSISFTTIYGFWLSQTDHSKLPIQCRSFQFVTYIIFISLHTSSSHLILGLPVRSPLVAILIFFTIHAEFIICMWPNHLIL